MDKEVDEIRALKCQFPGRSDILARETAYYAFKESMLEKIAKLPKAHDRALRKALYRAGYIDRARVVLGETFDREYAGELRELGVCVGGGVSECGN